MADRTAVGPPIEAFKRIALLFEQPHSLPAGDEDLRLSIAVKVPQPTDRIVDCIQPAPEPGPIIRRYPTDLLLNKRDVLDLP
jgi:hypothetical protein